MYQTLWTNCLGLALVPCLAIANAPQVVAQTTGNRVAEVLEICDAAWNGDLATVKRFLAAKGDPNYVCTLAHLMDYHAIERLKDQGSHGWLDAKTRFPNWFPNDRPSLLSVAIRNGQTSTAEAILRAGADVNLDLQGTDTSIEPPVFSAAFDRNYALTMLIIQRGALLTWISDSEMDQIMREHTTPEIYDLLSKERDNQLKKKAADEERASKLKALRARNQENLKEKVFAFPRNGTTKAFMKLYYYLDKTSIDSIEETWFNTLVDGIRGFEGQTVMLNARFDSPARGGAICFMDNPNVEDTSSQRMYVSGKTPSGLISGEYFHFVGIVAGAFTYQTLGGGSNTVPHIKLKAVLPDKPESNQEE